MLAESTNQMFLCDMCVPLGCGYRCVSQKFLDNSNISAVTKQESCHCMTQHVRCDASLNASVLPEFCNYIRHALGRQATCGRIQEKGVALSRDPCSDFKMSSLNPNGLFVNDKGQTITATLSFNSES